MAVSFVGLIFVEFTDGFAPVFLVFKVSLGLDEGVLVEGEGAGRLNEDGFGGGDEGVESGFLVSEGGLFVGKVVFEGSPVGGLLGFSVSIVSLGLGEGVVDVIEEVEDVDDVFIVKFGGEFRQTDDEGLEEGGEFGALLEVFLDLFESGLDLGEGDTVDHVLDELDGFVDLVDGVGVFVVDVDPAGVFSFSLGGTGFEGGDGFVVVGGGEVQVGLGLGQQFGVRFDRVLDGGDRFGLGVDLEGELGDHVFTEGFVGFVVGIRIGLAGLEGFQNFIDGGLDFGDG